MLQDSITLRRTLTYPITGLLQVPSGATGYLCPFFIPVPPDETWGLVGVWTIIRAGTSCTFKIQQNGADVTGMTGLVATTTKAFYQTTTALDIQDSDLWAPVITAISGTPDGMSVTFFFDTQLNPDSGT